MKVDDDPLSEKPSANPSSVDNLLVPHLPSPAYPMPQPLPRDPPSSLLLPAALTPQPRARLRRPPRMDSHLWGSPLPSHLPPDEA